MEFNLVLKKFRAGMAGIAYLFPSTYEAMLSSLPTHMIYYIANSIDEVYLERFHIKKFQGEEPPPRSVETGAPLRRFEMIIVSLHYEVSIIDVLRALLSAGIEPYRKKREQVIIAGGPAVISNPIPYSDFIDAFIIGEIENTIPRFVKDWVETRNKKEYLEKIASYNDVYVPDIKEDARKSFVSDLDKSFYPVKQIQNTEIEPVYGRGFLLETSRGCKYWCRFCMEGRLFKPYRARSFHVMKNLIEHGIRMNNVNRIIIYSLCFLGTLYEKELLEYLVENNIGAVLPSMRIDHLDEDSLELIGMLGQKTVTIAPESFLPAKKCIFGKYCGRELLDDLELILDKGFDLKIYMIVGVRGLENIDLDEIKYIEKLSSRAKKKGRKIVVSVNPLIPKPRTPFQWIGMLDPVRLKRIIKSLKNRLRRHVDFRDYDVRWAMMQAAIALAGRDISETLLQTAKLGGGLSGWRRALKITDYNINYIFNGYKPGKELPWSRIAIDKLCDKIAFSEYEQLISLLRNTSGDHS